MIGEICTFPGNLRFFANLAWAWSVRGSRRCVRFIHMARSMFSECKVIGYLQIRDVRWEESNLVSRTKVHFILQKGWLQQGAARAALNIPDGEANPKQSELLKDYKETTEYKIASSPVNFSSVAVLELQFALPPGMFRAARAGKQNHINYRRDLGSMMHPSAQIQNFRACGAREARAGGSYSWILTPVAIRDTWV